MPDTAVDTPAKANWRIIFSLVPYLLEFRGRVIAALLLLVAAKIANVAVPVALKHIIDSLSLTGAQLIAVPMAMLVAYGGLRFASVFLGELRDAIFARVAERGMRRVTLTVFKHLHAMDLAFHLSRKTGGLSRDIDRGTNGISFLLRFMLFNILPTLLEIALVAGILWTQFSGGYVLTVIVSVAIYIAFSVVVTEWRNRYVREANEQDSRTNTRALDSLLNYETVKYFNNENYEINEYDRHLQDWEKSRLNNRLSLFALNSGQAFIIAAAILVMMIMAAQQVAQGQMTIGELVMINAYMIQLFIPLNFLGFVYREIRQSLINIERMFHLLDEKSKLVDKPNAPALQLAQGEIEFNNIDFSYDGSRQILHNVSFTIPAGKKVAIVGASGSGKSTLARLLFRFYDVTAGSLKIDGQDVRDLDSHSVHQAIGVVPQDTVLFNDTIYYNIAYAKPTATAEQVYEAARLAHLDQFIQRLPQGYETLVGERGLKVSGGEKQRIAIARMLLKNPPILIFDEATSALDSNSEKAILSALNSLARQHTTLVIAHRLSTIMDAYNIVVLDGGRVIEQGSHQQLLGQKGAYAQLWEHQQEEKKEEGS